MARPTEWGGERPSAGRPLLGAEREQTVHVSLPADMIAALGRLGQGNVSAGIRALVSAWERGELAPQGPTQASALPAAPLALVTPEEAPAARRAASSYEAAPDRPDIPPRDRVKSGTGPRGLAAVWNRPIGELVRAWWQHAEERAAMWEDEEDEEDEAYWSDAAIQARLLSSLQQSMAASAKQGQQRRAAARHQEAPAPTFPQTPLAQLRAAHGDACNCAVCRLAPR